MSILQVKEGGIVPLQVAWLDEVGRAFSVQNVTYTVFNYVGGVRTEITNANLPMGATDQSYRYLIQYEIPVGYAGTTIFVEFKSELIADGTTLIKELILQVSQDISSQRLLTSFS